MFMTKFYTNFHFFFKFFLEILSFLEFLALDFTKLTPVDYCTVFGGNGIVFNISASRIVAFLRKAFLRLL